MANVINIFIALEVVSQQTITYLTTIFSNALTIHVFDKSLFWSPKKYFIPSNKWSTMEYQFFKVNNSNNKMKIFTLFVISNFFAQYDKQSGVRSIFNKLNYYHSFLKVAIVFFVASTCAYVTNVFFKNFTTVLFVAYFVGSVKTFFRQFLDQVITLFCFR